MTIDTPENEADASRPGGCGGGRRHLAVLAERGGWRVGVVLAPSCLLVRVLVRVVDPLGYEWLDYLKFGSEEPYIEDPAWDAWTTGYVAMLMDGFASELCDPVVRPRGPRGTVPDDRGRSALDDRGMQAILLELLRRHTGVECTGPVGGYTTADAAWRFSSPNGEALVRIHPTTRSASVALAERPWTERILDRHRVVPRLAETHRKGSVSARDLSAALGVLGGGWTRMRPSVVACLDRHCRPEEQNIPAGSLETLVSVLTSLPDSWLPRTDEEFASLLVVANVYEFFYGDMEDPATIRSVFRGSKGRWTDYSERLERETAGSGGPVRSACDVEDLVRAVDEGIVGPAMAGRFGEEDLDLSRAVAFRIVHDRSDLLTLLRRSAVWHAGRPTTVGDERTWDAVAEPFSASGETTVVFLTSGGQLGEEGAAMSHCVDTYGGYCAAGISDVASVRDGDGRRLSTVEIRFDDEGRPRVRQHRAEENGDPPERAVAAVEEWLSACADGRIAASPRRLDPAARTGSAAPSFRPEEWKGILPRRYVRMTAEEIGNAVRAIVAEIKRVQPI